MSAKVSAEAESENCAICFIPLSTELEGTANKVKTLACGHSFHKRCIAPWEKQKLTCPICRAPKPLDDFLRNAREGNIAQVRLQRDEFPSDWQALAFCSAAQHGRLATVQFLLTPATPPFRREQAISAAAQHGHLATVQFLLQDERDTRSLYARQAFIQAAGNGHVDIVRWLLERYWIPDRYLESATAAAEQNNYPEVVNLLREEARNRSLCACVKEAFSAVARNCRASSCGFCRRCTIL